MSIKEISEFMIQKIKDEIDHYANIALDASVKGNHDVCQDALRKQHESIQNLISLIDSYGALK